MTKHPRADPRYQYLATWEPTRPGLSGDLAESLLTGSLLAAVIILGDRVILGQWCDLPAMGFVWSACILAVWIRTRTRGRVKPSELVATDKSPELVKERVIMVNPPRPEEATERAEDQRRSDFERFIMTCQRTTALRDHERLGMSRAEYEEYRDILLRLGWAQWRSRDRTWRRNRGQSDQARAKGFFSLKSLCPERLSWRLLRK